MGPLKAKDFDQAERQKFAIEELQRKDKKNRLQCEKNRNAGSK
jgi:hypothetical protein